MGEEKLLQSKLLSGELIQKNCVASSPTLRYFAASALHRLVPVVRLVLPCR